jgi:hypothetical protein
VGGRGAGRAQIDAPPSGGPEASRSAGLHPAGPYLPYWRMPAMSHGQECSIDFKSSQQAVEE